MWHAAAVVLQLSITIGTAAGCATEANCAYSGDCVAGVCRCDAAWSGENCTTLVLLPATSINAAGLRRRSSSSWGGSAVLDPMGKLYTMFFSDFGHCGLDSWQRNSRIGVALASKPLGPYAAMEKVALPPFAHNPTVHGPAPDGSWLIYHIGSGEVGGHGSPVVNCTNGTTPTAATVSAEPAVVSPPHLAQTITPDILVAKSLRGPWTKLGKGGGCNNPGPVVLKNGTVLLICKVAVTSGPGGAKPWRQMAVYVAPSYKGPYELKRLTPVYGEDAYAWYDPKRDAFHMLLHAMHPRKMPTTAWSKNGLDWTPNGFAGPPNPAARPSFNSSIALAAGAGQPRVLHVHRRERHQPIFSNEGELIGLCNGVTTGELDYSFTACVPIQTASSLEV